MPPQEGKAEIVVAVRGGLADHYGFVVLPARVRRPRDKAKVEAAVGIVSRFVLGKLRNRRFFSLVECPQQSAEKFGSSWRSNWAKDGDGAAARRGRARRSWTAVGLNGPRHG
jgi:transposase